VHDAVCDTRRRTGRLAAPSQSAFFKPRNWKRCREPCQALVPHGHETCPMYSSTLARRYVSAAEARCPAHRSATAADGDEPNAFEEVRKSARRRVSGPNRRKLHRRPKHPLTQTPAPPKSKTRLLVGWTEAVFSISVENALRTACAWPRLSPVSRMCRLIARR